MNPLKRLVLDTVDEAIKQAFDRVWEWTEQFSPKRLPWLDGVMVETQLASGDNTVEHKLGRVPRGFFVLKLELPTADEHPAFVSADAKFLTVNAANPSLVTLWVWG